MWSRERRSRRCRRRARSQVAWGHSGGLDRGSTLRGRRCMDEQRRQALRRGAAFGPALQLRGRLQERLDCRLARLYGGHRDPGADQEVPHPGRRRSEEHTSELQSLMRISYAVFCLKKKKKSTYLQHTKKEQTNTRHIDNTYHKESTEQTV